MGISSAVRVGLISGLKMNMIAHSDVIIMVSRYKMATLLRSNTL